jgi:hypothetical protein
VSYRFFFLRKRRMAAERGEVAVGGIQGEAYGMTDKKRSDVTVVESRTVT